MLEWQVIDNIAQCTGLSTEESQVLACQIVMFLFPVGQESYESFWAGSVVILFSPHTIFSATLLWQTWISNDCLHLGLSGEFSASFATTPMPLYP